VLLLAGTDRLDRALTIGQMQGRFQMVLLPQARPHALYKGPDPWIFQGTPRSSIKAA
jgi:hypothetical protein